MFFIGGIMPGNNRYQHVPGCGCPACIAVERIREEKGDPNWTHSSGCSCGNCRTVRDIADARDLDKWVRNKR